jgi:hypothetical protein
MLNIRATDLMSENPSVHPGYLSALYYSTFTGVQGQGTAVGAIDTLYIYPFTLRQTVRVSKLAMRVNALGAASAGKIALWRNSKTLFRPVGAPLAADNVGQATTANNATAEYALPATLVLTPAAYWIGAKFTGTLPQMVSLSGGNSASKVTEAMIGRVALVTGAMAGLSLAHAYATALPTLVGNEAWAEALGVGIPVVWLKVA